MPLTSTSRAAGLGELWAVKDCDDILVAQGLGSCIGISVYAPASKIAILAHVMLPGPAPEQSNPAQPARYAEHAVAAIVSEINRLGGVPTARTVVVKLAGGAQVIAIPGMEDRLKIGARNIEAVHEALARHGLRVAAADTGGKTGRTVTLHAATGVTTVRVVGGVEQQL